MDVSQLILSEITIFLKYAKFLPEKQRRETWEELVDRNKQMHIKKFPFLEQEINQAYQLVLDKKVLPSMRSMQFAGKPIEVNGTRMFNCAYLPIDDWHSFQEIMFLLLGGTGVGFSVQKHHIEKLPEIKKPNPNRTKRFLVGDSIEGWSDAIRALMRSYFKQGSDTVNFDYRDIRPKGARLITTGGKAPGPEPLKICIVKIESVLTNKQDGDKLSSIEVYDIVNHIADAVLAGGIRRAALISLFSADDEEMIAAKSGNWWELNPQRGRSNNSAVLLRYKATKQFFNQLWQKIQLSGAGEPGIYFSNDKDWGTNPCCISGDTWVVTERGPQQVDEIIDQPCKLLIDGKFRNTSGFWKTGIKEVFEVVLKNGMRIKATQDHRFKDSEGEWIELQNLIIGSELTIGNNRDSQISWNGTGGTVEEGWLLGNLIGDGTISECAIFRYWNEEIPLYDICDDYLSKTVRSSKKDREYDRVDVVYERVGNDIKARHSKRFLENALRWGVYRGNKHFNEIIERGSSGFYSGIIGGIYDADGSIWGNPKSGLYASICQSHLPTVEIIQRMLLRLGIPSDIYHSNKGKVETLMPDGKGGAKWYKVQPNYELRISGRYNVVRFFKIIHIRNQKHIDKFHQATNSYQKQEYVNKNQWICEVIEINKIGLEEVYDITVPSLSYFDGNGFIVHNCEISLRPFQFCNLTEINASTIQSQEDYNQRAKVAAFIGTLQASYTDFHYLRSIWRRTTEKDALLGVSMTGIASMEVFKYDIERAVEVVRQENERVAQLIGINKAARLTDVKPAGTTSLALGTSSGIHAWHDPFYLRRLRIGKNESLYTYLSIYHSELIKDEIFRPHDTAVIEVPQKAPQGAVTRDESAIDLLERVKTISQRWVKPGHISGSNSHNVSATISIKEDEWDQVGEWMWRNKDYYNGLACLPHSDHSYVQSPFETITEKQYKDLAKHLHGIDLSQVVEIEDVTDLKSEAACSSGACEII